MELKLKRLKAQSPLLPALDGCHASLHSKNGWVQNQPVFGKWIMCRLIQAWVDLKQQLTVTLIRHVEFGFRIKKTHPNVKC